MICNYRSEFTLAVPSRSTGLIQSDFQIAGIGYSPDSVSLSVSYAESTRGVCHLRQSCHRWQVLLHVLCTFFLLTLPCSAQERRTFPVPFHTVGGLILLDGQANDKPAALPLDTGADNSLISSGAAGIPAKLRPLSPTNAGGSSGDYVKGRVDLRLDKRHWIDRAVLLMDLSEASKRLPTRIDGFIGQDILREFSAVRIDYKASVLVLEP